jgi:hypothetical protein
LMMGMDQNMWKLKTFVFTYKKKLWGLNSHEIPLNHLGFHKGTMVLIHSQVHLALGLIMISCNVNLFPSHHHDWIIWV